MRATILIITPYDNGNWGARERATQNANELSGRLHKQLTGEGKLQDLCTVLVPLPERSPCHGQPISPELRMADLATMVHSTKLVYVDFFAVGELPFLCEKTIDTAMLAAGLGRKVMVLAASEDCLQTANLFGRLKDAGLENQMLVVPNGLPVSANG